MGAGGQRHRAQLDGVAIRVGGLDQQRDGLSFLHRAIRDRLENGRFGARVLRGHHQRVAAGAVGVEETDEVVPLVRRIARLGEPRILRRHDLAVRAHYTAHGLHTTEGIRQLDVEKPRGWRSVQLIQSFRPGGRTLRQARRRTLVGHERVAAIAFVDAQRIAVQCQEVAHEIPARQVHPHVLDQKVHVGLLQDGGQHTAQLVRVGEGRREIDELARQTGDHAPAAATGLLGGDLPEAHTQAVAGGLVVDEAREDLEADQQPLFVIHDLGLRRLDLDLAGRGRAVVLYSYAERERLGRLDGRGEGIIRIDVLGQKVIQRELGQWLYVDRVGRHLHGLPLPCQCVGERRAYHVQLAGGRGSPGAGRRDDEPVNLGGGGGGDAPLAGDVADPGQGVDADEKLGGRIIGVRGRPDRVARLVGKRHIDRHALQCAGVEAVGDPHLRVERLAFQSELLLDLDAHLGADGILRASRQCPRSQGGENENNPRPRPGHGQVGSPFHITSNYRGPVVLLSPSILECS